MAVGPPWGTTAPVELRRWSVASQTPCAVASQLSDRFDQLLLVAHAIPILSRVAQ
jgi:hypothetical protein